MKKRKTKFEKALKAAKEAKQRAEIAEADTKRAWTEAERWKARFRDFGKNVEVLDDTGAIACVKWELKPETWGQYLTHSKLVPLNDETWGIIKEKLAVGIARGLIEQNLVQIVQRDGDGFISAYNTIGAKLYVVPWEQMPHKKIELRQFVLNEELQGGT